MTQARDLADGKFDTDTLVVDAANNRVGVGTASPSSALTVDGGPSSVAAKFKYNGSNSYIVFENDTRADGYVGYDNSGNLEFWSANSERMTLLAGGGITFNGDTAAANALDDYEEGTWTPIDASGQSLSLTINYATYTKVGRLVHVEFDIVYPTTSNTANARISLPVTGVSIYFSGIVGWSDNNTNVKIHGVSSSFAYFMDGGDPTSGNIHISNSGLSGKRLIGSFTYY